MYPDAANQPTFPPNILRPGATYRQSTVWRLYDAGAGPAGAPLRTCMAAGPACVTCSAAVPELCEKCEATHRLDLASNKARRGGVVRRGDEGSPARAALTPAAPAAAHNQPPSLLTLLMLRPLCLQCVLKKPAKPACGDEFPGCEASSAACRCCSCR